MFSDVDAKIEKLLILQDRDVKRISIEAQLESIPNEVALLKRKIEAEKKGIEEDRTALKALEVRRSELDGQVKVAEQKILKYKNQQLEVKKNDEYRALTQEIENMEASIGQLEEEEIGLMLKIDEESKVFAESEKERLERIRLLESEIKNLTEREGNLKSEKQSSIDAVAEAEKEVAERYLFGYNKVKNRKTKPLFVVPLEEQKCKGCHLKVSGEVESGARHFKDAIDPTHCDSCGRIVYWDR